MLEPANTFDPGANDATARANTIKTSTPRTNPNTAPTMRSNQRSPTSFIAQRVIRPAAPASITTATKTTRNATMFATQGEFTYGANHGATCRYPQAANKYPRTTPARENAS